MSNWAVWRALHQVSYTTGCIVVCANNILYDREDSHLYLQHLALIILKHGVIKAAVSNRNSKMKVMKMLHFGLQNTMFSCLL